MDDAVKVALVIGAAIVLFMLFFQGSGSSSSNQGVTFQVPYTPTDDVQNFVSPSGGPSIEFVPNDNDKVYADYA